jgi:hypothetical protein
MAWAGVVGLAHTVESSAESSTAAVRKNTDVILFVPIISPHVDKPGGTRNYLKVAGPCLPTLRPIYPTHKGHDREVSKEPKYIPILIALNRYDSR